MRVRGASAGLSSVRLFALGFGDALLKEASIDVGYGRSIQILLPLLLLFPLREAAENGEQGSRAARGRMEGRWGEMTGECVRAIDDSTWDVESTC